MIAPRPLVLGHRGASAGATDNSIEAFELAIAQGADGVELDVRFTTDGVVMLHHDPEIGEMGPLIYHEFATVRRKHPEVPTLDEALDVLGDLIINVEIKNSPLEPDFDPGHKMAEVVARWVSRHDIHGRVIVTSFNPATVGAVRDADPSIVTGQLVGTGFDFEKGVHAVAAAGHTWIAPNVADVVADPGTVAISHHAGLQMAVWTVDGDAAIRAVAAAGADAIITNDPAATLDVLGGSAV